MATKWLFLLLLIIVVAYVPVVYQCGSLFPKLAFLPFGFIAVFLAQIIAFRIVGLSTLHYSIEIEKEKTVE